MQLIQLLERYGIKPAVSKYSTTRYTGEKYSISCRDCNEFGKPCTGKQPTLDQYFVDMNPMHEAWAKILNQPFEYSAENMGFYCFIHYMSFVLRNCDETLQMIHDYMSQGEHP